MNEINAEYEKLCIKVGDADYKIRQYQKLVKQFYEEIDKLNELAALMSKNKQKQAIVKEGNEDV